MHARLNTYKRSSRGNDAARWAAALASITQAATESGEDANRLPRRIAQAVAAGTGRIPGGQPGAVGQQRAPGGD